MKQCLSIWQFGGFVFTTLVGSILHFLFDWMNESSFVAPFSAVNESTWEHMKLIYFPMLIFAIIQSHYFYEYKNFWCIKLIGIITGLILIPMLFYTYNGVLGKSSHFVNIGIFFVTAAISFILEWYLFKNNTLTCKHPWLPFIATCLIGLFFVMFTYSPPNIPLFNDPLKSKAPPS